MKKIDFKRAGIFKLSGISYHPNRLRATAPGVLLLASFIFSGLFSCKKDVYTSDVYIEKQWKVTLSASYTIPSNTDRSDHAVAVIYLMDNNLLNYHIYFDTELNNGDVPANAALYLGSAVENGTVLVNLSDGSFNSNRELAGNIQLDTATANKLLTETVYLQVNSAQVTTGLVRGQIDKTVLSAFDINLSQYNTSVNTTAEGVGYFRQLSDYTLVYQINVSNMPAADALTSSYIHKTNDTLALVTLASSAADFNVPKKITVSSAVATSIASDNLSVDVYSNLYPNGLLTGVVR